MATALTTKSQDVVLDRAGNAIVGAAVRVYAPGTSTLSSIALTSGGAAINQTTSPVLTDANGHYEFYTVTGTYDLVATYGTSTSATQAGVVVGGGTPFGPTWSPIGGAEYNTSNTIEFQSGIEALSQSNFVDVTVSGALVESFQIVAALNIDPCVNSLYAKTLSAPATFTFSDPPNISYANGLYSFTLEITNSGGARTITWPASVKWPGGVVPTPTTGVDVYTFYKRDDQTSWRGALVASYTS